MRRPLRSTSVPESLAGQFLIAMPGMTDKRFARSVVYMCMHSSEQAMGIIINRRADNVSFSDVLQHIALDKLPDVDPDAPELADRAVHFGGPVQTTRGFVLHSPDYMAEKRTLPVQKTVSLTATVDVLQAIASGRGPQRSLFALGYAGWAGGQLETEIGANGWLFGDADADIIFETDIEDRYGQAMLSLGIEPGHLVADAGHA